MRSQGREKVICPSSEGKRGRVNPGLQRLETIQGWRKVVAAGHGFSKAQHGITLAVGIAKHAQQLLFNVMDTRAVRTEIEAVSAAGGAVRQALTNNLQPFTIFF